MEFDWRRFLFDFVGDRYAPLSSKAFRALEARMAEPGISLEERQLLDLAAGCLAFYITKSILDGLLG
jgi:hypothetical protein